MSSYPQELHDILKKNEIRIVCESPFELESFDDQGQPDGTATGYLARLIKLHFEKKLKKKKK